MIEGPGACLKGIPLITPGTASLPEDRESLEQIGKGIELAADAGAPTVLLSEPLQTKVFNWRAPPNDNRAYPGNLAKVRAMLDECAADGHTSLISGGKLASTEGTLILSAAVAEAEAQGLRGRDIVSFTRKFFAEYFRFLESGPA